MDPSTWPTELGVLVTLTVIVVSYLVLMHIFAVLAGEEPGQGDISREAEMKAEQMLEELLSPAELRMVREHGYLEIASRLFERRFYRVPYRHGLVGVYENGVLIHRLCVGAVEPVPAGDLLLIHKLMIEASEEEYLRRANRIRPTLFSS